MANTRKTTKDHSSHSAPLYTIESQQDRMIALAVSLAEKQLQEGTASAQVITHYLKLGTTRERLEKEKLEKENELLRAKTESLKSQKHTEELYAKALSAFRSYGGMPQQKDDEDEDPDLF